MLDVLKGMMLGLAVVLIGRSTRRRAAGDTFTDDGVKAAPDPVSGFLEKLGENAPALFAHFTSVQSDQRRHERRETARQDAFAWRELALRCIEAKQHGAADRAQLHAEQLERQHELFDPDDQGAPGEMDDDEPAKAAAAAPAPASA